MFFPKQVGATYEELHAGNVKEFIGDGSTTIALPGLTGPIIDGQLTVERVTVDGVEIPLRVGIQLPDMKITEKRGTFITDMPMIDVVQNQDGTPCLYRSICSNHGVWQKGSRILVWAQWNGEEKAISIAAAPEKTKEELAAETVERLNALTDEQLQSQALALKIGEPDKIERAKLIAIILQKSGLPASEPEKYKTGGIPPELLAMTRENLLEVAKQYNVNPVGKSNEKLAKDIAISAGYTVDK